MVEITIPILITAALLDSINPCVIGVLVFLLAYISRAFKTVRKMLFVSVVYTAVVYITYLLLGLGILHAVLAFELSIFFYTLAAAIAGLAGLLEIKDFFWYGRGFSLAILPAASKRLEYYTEKFMEISEKNKYFGVLFAAALGVFVVLIELPCTGAPYFAILGLLSQGDYSAAIPLLLLYNFIFILPLIALVIMAYLGVSLKSMQKWKQANRRYMRLVIGLFLLGISAYMLYTIYIL
jgi:cytochrome c biogenesis protein CcdA